MRTYFTRSLGILALAAGLSTLASSCTKDLDQTPEYLASNPDLVYADPTQIAQLHARLYATYAVSGQGGASGTSDISGIDGGFSNYIRVYWQLQEITSDEAVLGWNDGNLPAVNTNTWNADNEFIRATFQRIYFQIGLCNDFIRQTSDANLEKRGLTGANAATIRQFRAEARLLRALSYWHALDLFGGGPFTDETVEASINNVPPYKKGSELFTYIESELKDLDTGGLLLEPRAVYGRADKAMCWTLLSKLYLNAKVYTNTDRAGDALTYADRVLTKGGYSLAPTYANLFLADNDRTSASEAIFPITFDGVRTQSFGGMTFLVHASVGRAISPSSAGINSGWAGLRTKPNLVSLFPGGITGTDARQAMFFVDRQNPNVDTLSVFSSGVLVRKFRNVSSTGATGSDLTGNFPDTDFFMFRLADVKLMYAEALLRNATGGTSGTALQQVNEVRARSGASALASVSLNDILDERGRELFWEGHRRSDLIRFGKYTKGYNWPFKGNVKTGKDIEDFRALFPFPNTERVLNTSLPQNPGY
jgi:hypothetical protein